MGWRLGVDRTVLALEAEELDAGGAAGLEVVAVPLGEEADAVAVELVAQLRQAGVRTDLAFGDRGLKGAMKGADRSGAAYAVVLGDRDLAEGDGQLKDMKTGEQDAGPGREAVRDAAWQRWGSDIVDGAAAAGPRPVPTSGVVGLGTWQLGGDWGDVDDDAPADVLRRRRSTPA